MRPIAEPKAAERNVAATWATWAALVVLTFLAIVLPAPAWARAPLAAIVVDARTGKVLFAKNADAPRYPASISKVMTLYLLFRELKAGRLSPSSRLHVSRRATLKPPSKLWLRPGQTISVDQAIRALVVKSANDVASVVAENIAGSEAAFARRMTIMARALGMTRTTFRNASGLPTPPNISTARDLATLSLRLMRDFPRLYRRYFGLRYFVWRGRRHRNHNHLLGRVRGMDGIKTGYTRAAGSSLAASVRRGSRRIVAVVLSAPSARARNAYMTRLIESAFRRYRLAAGTRVAALAGTPPGFDARRARLFLAKIESLAPMRARRPARVRSRKAKASPAPALPDARQARRLALLAKKASAEKRRTARKVPVVKPMPRPSRPSHEVTKESGERLRATHEVDARRLVAILREAAIAEEEKKPASALETPRRMTVGAASEALTAKVQVRVVPDADAGQAAKEKPLPAVDARQRLVPALTLMQMAIATPHATPALRTTAPDVNPNSADGEVLVITKSSTRETTGESKVETPPARDRDADEKDTARAGARESRESFPANDVAKSGEASAKETKSDAEAGPTERIVLGDATRLRRLARRWLIQIGAFPTFDGAKAYLERARKLSRHVRDEQPLVVRVERNGKVFFRARYAGFSRRDAVRACRDLRRRGLSCLPMAPHSG